MKSDFILDETGRITNCDLNIAKMSILKYMAWQAPIIGPMAVRHIMETVMDALESVVSAGILLVVAPFVFLSYPFAAARIIRAARREVAREMGGENK